MRTTLAQRLALKQQTIELLSGRPIPVPPEDPAAPPQYVPPPLVLELLEDLDEMMGLYCIALAIIGKPGQVLDIDYAAAREVAVRKFGEETAAVLFGAPPPG